jgi:DNA-binding NarL/FixJ family response regulator
MVGVSALAASPAEGGASLTPAAEGTPGVIRVYIVAEVRLYRDGLKHMLGRERSIEVVGTSESYPAARGEIQGSDSHVVLLDLPVADGAAATRDLLGLSPDIRVVALSLREEEADVIAWAEAGMSGYVSREGSVRELVTSIQDAARGEMRCSPRVAAALLKRLCALANHAGWRDPPASLTPREMDIIKLVRQGLSNREIARALFIALPTVKNHIHNILEKLQVRRREEAVSIVGASARLVPP